VALAYWRSNARCNRGSVTITFMEHELSPCEDRPTWSWLLGREDLPHEIAQVRDTRERIPIDQSTADRVSAWISDQGWSDATTPVRLLPATGPSNPTGGAS
jgi:hypothetical protein